jgi:uncharacterized protein (TIGR02231 family)
MKSNYAFLILVLIVVLSHVVYGDKVIRIDANNNVSPKVVLYQNGAVTVERTFEIQDLVGEQQRFKVHIQGLSNRIDPQSIVIRAKSPDDELSSSLTILDYSVGTYTDSNQLNKILSQQRRIQQDIVYNKEMLQWNDKWMTSVLSNRLDANEFRTTMSQFEKQKKQYLESINSYEQLLMELKNLETTPNNSMRKYSELNLTMQTTKDIKNVEIFVSYVIHDAGGWNPSYTLNLEQSNLNDQPITSLIYDASVRQESGEDWTDCRLILSTASPSLALQPSVPSEPRCAYIHMPNHLNQFASSPQMSRAAAPEIMTMAADYDMARDAKFTTASVKSDSFLGYVTYEIPVSVNLTSSPGTERYLRISSQKFDSKSIYWQHYAVTSSSNRVYRKVTAVNSNGVPLLPGPVKIVKNGMYVSSTQLTSGNGMMIQPEDTIDLFVGEDQNVKLVTRHIRENQDKGKYLIFSGGQQILSDTYAVEVTNNNRHPINLTLVDLIPKPNGDSIKVYLVDPVIVSKQTSLQELMTIPNDTASDQKSEPKYLSEKTVTTSDGMTVTLKNKNYELNRNLNIQGSDTKQITLKYQLVWTKDNQQQEITICDI